MFYYASEESKTPFSLGVLCSTFEDFIHMAKLRT